MEHVSIMKGYVTHNLTMLSERCIQPLWHRTLPAAVAQPHQGFLPVAALMSSLYSLISMRLKSIFYFIRLQRHVSFVIIPNLLPTWSIVKHFATGG